MCRAISNALVAAGDGALRTWTTEPDALDEEVVDQRAVAAHRLGAHPAGGRHEVVVPHLRHQPAQALGEPVP